MFIITLETRDPFFNLAIEEILLKNKMEEYLILGINDPSLIIGKHQSPHREINTRFITENNIPVIRRISGGGAVFHDQGNLNFTFISNSEPGRQIDFRRYTRPVMDFLLSHGVNVKFEGKSDLKVDGLKISGNAEHVHRNRVLHHGTLLFSTSLDMLRKSLKNDTSVYISKAVTSNPSSVTNLNDRLPGLKDINELRSEMLDYFLKNLRGSEAYILSVADTAIIADLAETKYRSWEWNWAYGPEYQFLKHFELQGEKVFCNFNVKDGIIWKSDLEGLAGLEAVGKKLIGCRHMVEDLQTFFLKENINISGEEIYNFF